MVKKEPVKKASEEVIDMTPKVKRTRKAKVETGIVPSGGALTRSIDEKTRNIQQKDIVNAVVSPSQLDILYGPIPKHALRKRPGRGGMTFTYVPYGYVVDALNKAFGLDWDFKLLPYFNGEMFKLTIDDTLDKNGKVVKTTRNITVYGELTIRVHSTKSPYPVYTTIVKAGVGSQNWEATVEFGDAVKGAKSDAVKVAAHQVGIGLALYYDDSVELNAYENKMAEQAAEAQRDAEEAAKLLVTNTPINGAVLLGRSMSEFGIGGADLSDILKVTLPEIINATSEQLVQWWDEVKLHVSMRDESESSGNS